MAQVVVNVFYNAPTDPEAFEAYYLGTHMPIAEQIPGLEKAVLLKGLPGPDGSPPAYYRLTQLWYADAAAMAAAMSSPQAQAASADIANFATGGASILISEVG